MESLAFVFRDELLEKVMAAMSSLIAAANDVAVEKESFQRFSAYVAQLKALLQELQAKRVGAKAEWSPMAAVLRKLEAEIKKAGDDIRAYNSGSRLRLLLRCHALRLQLQRSATEIANAVDRLGLANLDAALELKSKAEGVARGLDSLEFRSAAATEAIVSKIEESNAQNGRRQHYAKKLLDQIAEATGASTTISLVKREIELLRQEKRDLEDKKERAEAEQLSLLTQLLQSSEMAASPGPGSPCSRSSDSVSSGNLLSAFICPLSGEPMEDPVDAACGHSFERRAIAQYFESEGTACPCCGENLSSPKLTQNASLHRTIEEWKERDAQRKLEIAESRLASDDPSVLNQTLEGLQAVMEMPGRVAEASEKGLVPKLVEVLKRNDVKTKAALKCLCLLARYSQESKEEIAGLRAVRSIVKTFRVGIEPEAVDVLVTLSESEELAGKIGNTKDAIPSLVSLLSNPDHEISTKAQQVLNRLSSDTKFVIKMAEAGHFEPFFAHFHQGNPETRAAMATELTKMQLWDDHAQQLENEQFVFALTKMLSSNSGDGKLASLRCIRKLSAVPRMARFLLDRKIIPALVSLMRSTSSELQREIAEILILLLGASTPEDHQTNQSLQELHLQRSIPILRLASKSNPQDKASFLRLLLSMARRSDIARELIGNEQSAMVGLFSNIEGDEPNEARLPALKLICCIAESHPGGIPFPRAPAAKETVVTNLTSIFARSPNIEERSAAAGIIGRLPKDDAIDEVLCKSKALKAIDGVIRDSDGRHRWKAKEPPPAGASNCLLENALAALLRCTEPDKPKLQTQVLELELYPSLVHVLTTGSSLAKQRAAMALSHLSQSSLRIAAPTAEPATVFMPFLRLKSRSSSSPAHQVPCSLHGSACSSRHAFCLVRAGAVGPLVQTVRDAEPVASEAALAALDGLTREEGKLPHAAAAIVESQGVAAILEVLDKGSLSAKGKALDLLDRISRYSAMTTEQSQKLHGLLMYLVRVDHLKGKAFAVLEQIKGVPLRSPYS